LLAIFSDIPIDANVRVTALDREVILTAKRVDHACLVNFGQGDWLYHFEAVSRFRMSHLETQYWYMHDLASKYRLPIVSTMLLLTEEGVPDTLPSQVEIDLGGFHGTGRIEIVRLWKIPAERALSLHRPGVDPWVVLMDATSEQVKEAARRIARSQDRELALRMALLGGLRYGSREAFLEKLEMIVLNEEVLQDSVFYQMILEKGMEKGIEKGIEKGRTDGQRSLLRTLLTERFGDLPDWANERLASATHSEIEHWSAQLFKATSLSEIFN